MLPLVRRVFSRLIGKAEFIARKVHQKLVDLGGTPPDMEPEFIQIRDRCKRYTMTGIESAYSCYRAAEYVVRHRIPGDVVECGVWRGGSSMVFALGLMRWRDTSRRMYLYDTYEGLPEPGARDVDPSNRPAKEKWSRRRRGAGSTWCFASIEEVQRNVLGTGYPREKIFFVKGKVEDTIPRVAPKKISILRLDTDWFKSTYHELVHLFPRLSSGGVIIIDDYGHWKGAREAVDRYLGGNRIRLFLHRIDNSVRISTKA